MHEEGGALPRPPSSVSNDRVLGSRRANAHLHGHVHTRAREDIE
jgi:hypothetical protein